MPEQNKGTGGRRSGFKGNSRILFAKSLLYQNRNLVNIMSDVPWPPFVNVLLIAVPMEYADWFGTDLVQSICLETFVGNSFY